MRIRVAFALLLTGVFAGAPVGAQTAAVACRDESVLLRGGFGQARFAVEVADDIPERSRGLMFRESLAPFAGMLFVYDAPHAASFWMRNTLIPLDMLFVGETGRIRYIHENAVPGDETPIAGGPETFAVLEINGGLARRLGIEVGDALQHPAFDGPDAVLPCEGS